MSNACDFRVSNLRLHSPAQKYMVIEILLCGLGSLVSEGHLFFPKARTPTIPRFIYATQDSDGRRISAWAAEHDHMIQVP